MDLHPFAALRVLVPHPEGDVELRTGDLSWLVDLCAVAAAGVHEAGQMPFAQPWTECDGAERARRTLQWQLLGWAGWTPQTWRLDFVVRRAGVVVGTQSLETKGGYPVLREVTTGSWLGLAHHGCGTGKLMRSAVLHVAFEHLGALSARSSAYEDNAASTGVSRALGYVDDGFEVAQRRGERVRQRRFRMDHDTWVSSAARAVEVRVSGSGPAREALLGR